MKTNSLIFFLCITAFSLSAFAQKDKEADKIGIYENLNGFVPDDITLLDKDSNIVNFKQLIDKPTVLALVYYTCPGICSPLLDGLAELIDNSDLIIGKDYQVLTVSFNYSELPYLAKSKRVNYIAQIDRKIDEKGWLFFTGDSVNVYKLTNSVGFMFKREGKDFIHAATLIVISPEGKITRYLYGTKFLPFDLKMSVIESRKGKASPTISKVLKYCFSYDVEAKKYVLNITRIAATFVLSGVAIFFIFLVVKRKRKINTEN